ncbi:MAG: hypothetical protein LPH21_17620, partial [Shewanella sp.]|nr:hypothetical protein [Shewanella sp.]
DLGKSGALEPIESLVYDSIQSGILYTEKLEHSLLNITACELISKMTYTAYGKSIAVLDLDTFVRSTAEGYTLDPSFYGEAFSIPSVSGVAIKNFATTHPETGYTERELNRVRGILIRMIQNGQGVWLGCVGSADHIARQWGKSFTNTLDGLEVPRYNLPLSGG